MTGEFKDHFSDASNHYKQYRPRYPAELYVYLASISADCKAAWDCATGSGQSGYWTHGATPAWCVTFAGH